MDFKSLAVQCLIASDYTNPVAYTVETLTLYVQFDEITSPDRSIETPLVLGIVIRLAMRMGIHRNAKVNEGLTPFQDEMRRRLWGTIVGLDALHSLQLSLPSAIGKLDWDRAMPRNIHSTEFGPESTELPPSRPLTEHTEATYVIVKDRLLLELKDIMALTTNNEELSANEVGQCERSLAQAYATMPDCLRWSPPSEPNPQWSLIKSHVVAFDRVYQLCKCMLYRKFLRQAQTNTSVNQYRLMCVDAALKLLNHQTTLFFHLKPMFCPSINKRHKFTHPTLDFFVAGMVIALDLYHTEETEASTASYPSPLSDVDPGRREEMITALETSIQFWAQLKDFSTEAAKAYSVFSYVLQKVQGRQMHLDNSLKNETEHASNDMGMECTDVIGDAVPDKFEFDWVSHLSAAAYTGQRTLLTPSIGFLGRLRRKLHGLRVPAMASDDRHNLTYHQYCPQRIVSTASYILVANRRTSLYLASDRKGFGACSYRRLSEATGGRRCPSAGARK